MNDAKHPNAKGAKPEYLEIVHRPSGKIVALSCAFCGGLWDSIAETFPVAIGHVLSHIPDCPKNPGREKTE